MALGCTAGKLSRSSAAARVAIMAGSGRVVLPEGSVLSGSADSDSGGLDASSTGACALVGTLLLEGATSLPSGL